VSAPRTVAVLQPGYLPWLGYFDLVSLADVFVIYDDVQFDRGGWRNRNRLLGPNDAPQWITVPVHKRFPQRIDEVQLHDERWAQKHASTLKTLYARAPHFGWCYPALEDYLLGRRYERLLDLCLRGHEVLCQLLGVEAEVRLASALGRAEEGRVERLVTLCQDLGATRYISGDAARAYMSDDPWREAGIELVYQGYPHPTYPQRGGEFVSHLSALDALMFAGPDAHDFLRTSLTPGA
jgi:WbqC-like protein family